MKPKPITREMLVEFGKKILSHPDVDNIDISVSFKDNSNMNYRSKFKSDAEIIKQDFDVDEIEDDGT